MQELGPARTQQSHCTWGIFGFEVMPMCQGHGGQDKAMPGRTGRKGDVANGPEPQ